MKRLVSCGSSGACSKSMKKWRAFDLLMTPSGGYHLVHPDLAIFPRFFARCSLEFLLQKSERPICRASSVTLLIIETGLDRSSLRLQMLYRIIFNIVPSVPCGDDSDPETGVQGPCNIWKIFIQLGLSRIGSLGLQCLISLFSSDCSNFRASTS